MVNDICGIIFAESFKGKNVTKLVAQQYDNQKLRGQEGFGLYDPTRNHLVRNTKEKRILKWLGKHKSSSILFHHRFPTSTDNVKNACHPFSTKDFFKTNYVLVHNGHISNSYSLKREHEKLGIKYHSVQSNGRFNDSEALLWDVALYLEGQQSELKAEGNIAFICLAQPKDGRKTRKLYFGRNTNPLNLHFSKQTLMLSSEGPGEATEAQQLYEYNYRTKKLTHQPLNIPIYRPVSSTTTYGNDYSTYPWDSYGNYSATRWEDDELEPEYENSYALELLKGTNFSYEGLMETGTATSVTYQDKDGDSHDINALVAETVNVYLEESFGLYGEALEVLDADLDNLNVIRLQDENNGLEEDEQATLQADILRLAIDVLFSSPYYKDDNSVDPMFAPITNQQLLTA